MQTFLDKKIVEVLQFFFFFFLPGRIVNLYSYIPYFFEIKPCSQDHEGTKIYHH